MITNIFVYLFSYICYICKIFVLKQSFCKYRKRLLLRCMHSFKADLINNIGPYRHFGYWTLIRLSVGITFAWIIYLRPGVEIKHTWSGVGPILSVVSVVVSGIGRGWSCRAGIGQPEGRGLVGESGIWAWVRHGYSADTAGIYRG